jgi:hypothetical protein
MVLAGRDPPHNPSIALHCVCCGMCGASAGWIDFWYRTMMDDRVEMQHRIACSVHLMDRAYGKTVQIMNEQVTEHHKQILEVRWLSPDPADRSRLIQPEPD